MPTITCPNCKTLRTIPPKLMGLKVTCRKCDAMFVAGKVVEESVDPEPEPTMKPEEKAKLIGQLILAAIIIGGIAWCFSGCYGTFKEIKDTPAKPTYWKPQIKGDDIYYTCPGCGSKMKSNLGLAGSSGNCPDCGAGLIVPRVSPRP